MLSPRVFVIALILVSSAVLAGCVQNPSDAVAPVAAESMTVAANWPELALPSSLTDPEHDHSDPAQHANLSTPNFHVLGWDPLVTDHYGTTLTGMGCGGVANAGERRLAVVHSISTDVSFVVADVTDPSAPIKLGEYFLPNVVVWDATITADGRHVIVGAYPLVFGGGSPVLPPVPPSYVDIASNTFSTRPVWRDACTGTVSYGPEQYLPLGPGIVLVGIQDPSNPTFEDWVSQPVIGPHSVSSQLIDGKVYATSSVTNLVHESSYYTFFEVVEAAGRGKLMPLSVIQAPGVESPALNGHTDVELHKHPVTGQLLAYLANWDGGLAIYDMSIPQAPVPLTTWKDGTMGAMHSIWIVPDLWDDKQYLIVGQEVGEPVDLPSGLIYILDITDPENPVEVSRWTLPYKPKWDNGGLQFSTHYMATVGKTMFVSFYHGGLWAVDLTDLETPRTVGVFLPDRVSPMPFGGNSYGPTVEDVVPDPATGILTIWDNAGGIYQLHFDETKPAPAVAEWPLG